MKKAVDSGSDHAVIEHAGIELERNTTRPEHTYGSTVRKNVATASIVARQPALSVARMKQLARRNAK